MNLSITTDPAAAVKFEGYPPLYKRALLQLRSIIIECAAATDPISQLEETLKWGEPSYFTKYGSTIRIDYKDKGQPYYAIYFKCTSKLVPAIRAVYGEIFTYEKNRALIFTLDDELPLAALKQVITAALRYHKVKHMPHLGMVGA